MWKSNVISLNFRTSKKSVEPLSIDGLIGLYGDQLKAFVRSLKASPEDMEEVVQETFCRFIELHAKDQMENPRAYLYKTARNILIDRYRRNRHQDNYQYQQSQVTGDDGEESTALDYAEMATAFQSALNELPPKCRQVFLLKRSEGLSSQEISAKLNISPRMVQKHMVKALEHFYATLR